MAEIEQNAAAPPPVADAPPAPPAASDDTSGPGGGMPQDHALNAQIFADVAAAMGGAAGAGDGGGETPGAPPPAPQATPKPPAEAQGQQPPAPPAADAADPNEPPIAAKLRARREAQKIRDGAKTEAERLRDEVLGGARAEAERIVGEAKRKADEEYRAKLGRLETDPIGAIGDLKWDAARLVDEVVKQGTPEWRLAKAQEAEIAALKTELAAQKDWQTKQDQSSTQMAEWQRQQYRERVTREFVSLASSEKAPHLRAAAEESFRKLQEARTLLGDVVPGPRSVEELIVAMGDAAEREFVEATGEVAPLPDLIHYLDYKARQQGAKPAPAGQPSAEQKGVTQQRAQGPRTLNAAVTSERRSAPKPVTSMTKTELDAALLETVSEAMRKPA